MTQLEESLKNDIELAKGISSLANSLNKAIAILARGILELDDNSTDTVMLKIGTRQALQTLAEHEDLP